MAIPARGEGAQVQRESGRGRGVKLNPWIIEIVYETSESIRVNIISAETGEIRQITLCVNDIAAIHALGVDRLNKAGDIADENGEKTRALDALLCHVSDEPYDLDVKEALDE